MKIAGHEAPGTIRFRALARFLFEEVSKGGTKEHQHYR